MPLRGLGAKSFSPVSKPVHAFLASSAPSMTFFRCSRLQYHTAFNTCGKFQVRISLTSADEAQNGGTLVTCHIIGTSEFRPYPERSLMNKVQNLR